MHHHNAKSFQVVSTEIGSPALPYFTESFIIPNKGNVELVVEYSNYQDYQNILVAPSKGNLKRNQNPSEIDYTKTSNKKDSCTAYIHGFLEEVTPLR